MTTVDQRPGPVSVPRTTEEWPDPIPLEDAGELKPVPDANLDLLPTGLRPRAIDIAERMQCPPAYVLVGSILAMSACVGRRFAAAPKHLDTEWTECANFWGAIIGRPGIMKTPALREALKAIYALENLKRDEHAEAEKSYEQEATEAKHRERL